MRNSLDIFFCVVRCHVVIGLLFFICSAILLASGFLIENFSISNRVVQAYLI